MKHVSKISFIDCDYKIYVNGSIQFIFQHTLERQNIVSNNAPKLWEILQIDIMGFAVWFLKEEIYLLATSLHFVGNSDKEKHRTPGGGGTWPQNVRGCASEILKFSPCVGAIFFKLTTLSGSKLAKNSLAKLQIPCQNPVREQLFQNYTPLWEHFCEKGYPVWEQNR